MGNVPAACRGRRPVPLGPDGGRKGSAACRAGTEELEDEKMDRHPEVKGLRIDLPVSGGKLETYGLKGPKAFEKPSKPFTRVAYAAAHVVADPFSAKEPWLDAAIDWEATLAYRRHLWSWGFGVAEAMDTAQRGMGLDWKNSLELIQRTVKEGGGDVASGAG